MFWLICAVELETADTFRVASWAAPATASMLDETSCVRSATALAPSLTD
jgi:hypothetical protein